MARVTVGSVIKLWDLWADWVQRMCMCVREWVICTTCPDGWDVFWSDTQADESSDRPWRLSHQSETRDYEYSQHSINANLTPSLLSIRSQISVYNVRAATRSDKTLLFCQGHVPQHFTKLNPCLICTLNHQSHSITIKCSQMRTERKWLHFNIQY